MHRLPSSSKRLWHTLAGASTLAILATLQPAPADAHFILDAPAAWMSQDPTLGLPQKLGPCGNEGGGTATGAVTAYAPGATVTITIDEKIFHPGHYRVALSTNGQAGLPAEPPVTAGATPCDTTVIEDPPEFPILADGLFTHTVAFTAPQTATVTLPTNVTCTNCTLQVIEFMSDHGLNNPGGCFYHHCANITIGATNPGDGGTPPGSSSSSSGAASSGGSTTGVTSSGAASSGGPTTGVTSSGTASSGGPTTGVTSSGTASASSGGTTTGTGGAGTGEPPGMSSGCKCSMPGEGAPASLGSLVVLAALLRRRRRG